MKVRRGYAFVSGAKLAGRGRPSEVAGVEVVRVEALVLIDLEDQRKDSFTLAKFLDKSTFESSYHVVILLLNIRIKQPSYQTHIHPSKYRVT